MYKRGLILVLHIVTNFKTSFGVTQLISYFKTYMAPELGIQLIYIPETADSKTPSLFGWYVGRLIKHVWEFHSRIETQQ